MIQTGAKVSAQARPSQCMDLGLVMYIKHIVHAADVLMR